VIFVRTLHFIVTITGLCGRLYEVRFHISKIQVLLKPSDLYCVKSTYYNKFCITPQKDFTNYYQHSAAEANAI